MNNSAAETPTIIIPIEGTGLAFTGERYIPSERGEIRLEHIHRYAVALDISAGKDVLDIASGEGYGSFLLSTVARTVTGVDVSLEAVRHACAAYSGRNNLVFKQGSATKIDLPDQTFDVVISFETIEHLAEQSEMLSEIRRVLKPSGILLISSPNRPIYSEASGTANEFHVKELDFSEFDLLLREQFDVIHYFGQRMLIGSIVQSLDGSDSSLRALRDDGVNVQQTTGILSDPVYFLALCGASEALIPTIDASLMQPENIDLLKQYIGYAKWAIDSNNELELLRKLHSDLNDEHHKVAMWAQSLDQQNTTATQALLEREQRIAMLSDETVKRGERALGLEAELKAAHAEFSQLVMERDNSLVQLTHLANQLDEIREQYSRLDQEHQKVDSWAHSLDKELFAANLLLSERDKELAIRSDEAAKQREWILGLEAQLKSTQAELIRAIAERDNQITRLSQSMVELNKQIARLDQDVLRAEHELELQEQLQVDQLRQNNLRFEQERNQIFVAQSDKEKTLWKEYAERERVLQERLVAMHEELRKVDLEWMRQCTEQERLATGEKANLTTQIGHLQLQIQELSRDKAQLSGQMQALTLENTRREQSLHEQILVAQNELIRLEQDWAQDTVTQQNKLAEQLQSSATLQAQLQDQISAAMQLATHSRLAQDAVQDEIDSIKSSLTWRLTAPLRKLGRRSLLVAQDIEARTLQNQAFMLADADLPDTAPEEITHKERPEMHFEEINMTINFQAPANSPNVAVTTLDDLLEFHDEAFVRAAYGTLLRRTPDSEGMAYYMRCLRRGVNKLQVLEQISRSKEAKMHSIKLPGLKHALRRNKWIKLPIIGAMMRMQEANQKLHCLENQLSRLNDSNSRRFDQIEKAITSLSQMVVHQAQTTAGAVTMQRLGYGSVVDSWETIDKLLSLEGSNFLENLFQFTLGRRPEPKEFDHYIYLLDKGVGKLHIIELLFSCPECRTWLLKEQPILGQSELIVIPQVVGDVEPKPAVAIAAESIYFVEYDKPLVSVIVPVYGKIEYTLMCLKSIQNNLPEVEFEIIVVDDKSPDNTAAELSKIRGIKYVQNSTNLGFIRSCNHGAEDAKGEYLCFLNNDTEVMPGWLDELVQTFQVFPGTGLVGSKFIYPNGTLQEAGGILWQDGSAWNFGRNQDPLLPIYNYAREVDYCSGASIVIPSALFSELGGFDEHYLPAYCEDSDLALKVRDHGYRVIYQPLSIVVHYEGITSGTDTTQGAKAYQIENSKKLFSRWKDRLRHHQPNGIDVDKAKDRTAKQRVLILDHCTPTPDQDAGSVTVFNLLLLLRDMGFQVTFIPEDNFLYMPEYTTKLQRAGVEVLYAPYYTSVEQHLAESGSRYELAFLFRPVVVERHLETVRKYCSKAKVLYHTVDLHYLRMFREAKLLGDRAKQRAAEEMKLLEFKAIRSVDASIVHSTSELEILRPELPNEEIYVFPLILNIRGTDKPFDERSDIVFVGGYQHAPNVDAVQYFVSEIMPILRRKIPGVRFYAVGSKPPKEIFDLACNDVIITGFVEDLSTLLDKMRVSVAPLRYGAGIKGKIGTALATGLPTVATTLAAEGMSMTNDKNILVAETSKDIAKSIVRLYNDEALWKRLQMNGIEFAESAWGAKAAWNTLQSILAKMSIDISECKHALSLYE